jgi:opine dehydrogenase
MDWLKLAYDTTGADLYEAIHNQEGYYGIKAPPTLNHRYIFEDVPCSLVPIACIGQQYGVETGAMNALIAIANLAHGTDYWHRGRTLDRLGVRGMSVTELHHYVETGER